jgi:hypothetical protein
MFIEEMVMAIRIGFIWLGIRSSGRFCENCNASSGPIKQIVYLN